MIRRLLNWFLFQVGWFACILGAAHDRPFVGPLAAAVLLALEFFFVSDRKRSATLIVAVGGIGTAIDTFLGLIGVFSFKNELLPTWFCPLWLTALWMIFASTLPVSLKPLSGRPWISAPLGAFVGPISYYAGAAFGALEVSHRLGDLIILAVLWGLALPLLMRLTEWIGPRSLNLENHG